MQVDVALIPRDLAGRELSNTAVVVIDVLRAASTVATALANGAKRVIPVSSVAAAQRLSRELRPRSEVLLCGERGGVAPRGFDLGNSPFEYTKDRVRGKSVVLTTTNATQVLAKVRTAYAVALGALVNAPIVAEWLAMRGGGDVLLVCAGRKGRFSLEDAFGAGMILRALLRAREAELSDSAQHCLLLAEKYERNPERVMLMSAHGRYLRAIGLGRDLEICARVGTVDVVPMWGSQGLVAVRPEA